MTLTNQYVAPTTSNVKHLTSTFENGSTIQFSTGNIRPEDLAATDVSVYVEALTEELDEFLNSDEWREAAMEATPCEFRPAGSLDAVPEAAREYAIDKSEKARLRLRQQAEADAHAERCRVATPRELAQAKADREERAAAIREQSAKVRASSRHNSGW